MPGLCFTNVLISRDEGLHTDFACMLYGHLSHRLPPQQVYSVRGFIVFGFFSQLAYLQGFKLNTVPVN
jgi:hypothetical protein